MTPLATLPPLSFTCPRTCPAHRTHWCRFNALFTMIGAPRVHSHTVKIKVDYRDPDALRSAVLALGGAWIGAGSHKLFERAETGLGFTLPNWRYPLCATPTGELAYDDYHGSWGNVADLEKLRTAYTTGTVERAALALGWQFARTQNGIEVFHPQGGVLTVSNAGVCETTGFTGSNCHDARTALGLAADGEPVNKAEHDQTLAQIQLSQ